MTNRPGIATVALIVLAVSLVLQSEARADWSTLRLDQIVRLSDLIAYGRIVRITAGEPGPDALDLATLRVRDVLLGDPGLREVVFQMPGEGATASSPRYEKGRQGVWLLKKEPGAEHYTVPEPVCLRPRSDAAEIEDIIKKQPVRIELTTDKTAYQIGESAVLTITMRNVSGAKLDVLRMFGDVKKPASTEETPAGPPRMVRFVLYDQNVQERQHLSTLLKVTDPDAIDVVALGRNESFTVTVDLAELYQYHFDRVGRFAFRFDYLLSAPGPEPFWKGAVTSLLAWFDVAPARPPVIAPEGT